VFALLVPDNLVVEYWHVEGGSSLSTLAGIPLPALMWLAIPLS
jgi:hypothetical protein